MYFQENYSSVVAEPKAPYHEDPPQPRWVEVLADCPGVEQLYTYRVPEGVTISAGDILTVPFGSSLVGAIAIRLVQSLPAGVEADKVREVEEVSGSGFFSPHYWQLLERVARYYSTELISVIRVALPPKLLARSQKRVRLLAGAIPPGVENFCSSNAFQVLQLLRQSPSQDYSYQYIQRQIRGARRAVRELAKRGWVETYLEQPQKARPKLLKAVTLIATDCADRLTKRQLEVLAVLKNNGGELWLKELLEKCELKSATVIENLARKGCVAIEARETLRLLRETQPEADTAKVLTAAQREALEIVNSLNSRATVLLHGVTGSGKTEVYLQAIAPILQRKKSALVLVPEIALTPQLTDRFRARFGDRVCVYHSALTDGERYDTWRQMLAGEPQVVIGTRSAVFAPLPNLAMIVLDEEHDSSFQQSQPMPTYHARQVAQWRSELENFPLILGSATPSLESWLQSRGGATSGSGGNYYLPLPQRIQARPLPPVEVVDMRLELQRGNRSIFSHPLRQALLEIQEGERQGILFVSRRGHSTFVSCRSCGHVIECPHCDVSLSYHYTHEGAAELLRCHYCNYATLHPKTCPECGSPYLKFFGTGTQRVCQQLEKEFPQLRTLRFDSDTTRTKGAHRAILNEFARGKADLLIGTQMLTKGLDLAQVTLVGVVAADGVLFHADYRASERAFQTLTQVAGRAGRGEDAGKVIVQTYSPEHPVINAVRTHDYHSFTQGELSQRQSLNYPPYGSLILLRLSGIDNEQVRQTAAEIAAACQDLLHRHVLHGELEILGPAPAAVMRVARRYRWQILLKFSKLADGAPDLSCLRRCCPSAVSLLIEVDPLTIQ